MWCVYVVCVRGVYVKMTVDEATKHLLFLWRCVCVWCVCAVYVLCVCGVYVMRV